MTRLNLGLNRGLAAIYLFFSSDPVLPVCPATEPPPPGHHRAAAATGGATQALDRSHPRHPEDTSSADLAPTLAPKLFPRKRPVFPPASTRAVAARSTGRRRTRPALPAPRPSLPGPRHPGSLRAHRHSGRRHRGRSTPHPRPRRPPRDRSARNARPTTRPVRPNEKKIRRADASGEERLGVAAVEAKLPASAASRAHPLYRRNRRMVDCLAPHWACGGAAGASGAASVLGPKSVVPASARPWRACQPNPALKPRPQEDLPPAGPHLVGPRGATWPLRPSPQRPAVFPGKFRPAPSIPSADECYFWLGCRWSPNRCLATSA